jgi:hypothetical protein
MANQNAVGGAWHLTNRFVCEKFDRYPTCGRIQVRTLLLAVIEIAKTA